MSATTALKELGLDSLMLVRLRNAFARELGAELPAATVFSASDIRGLARALGEVLPERGAGAREEKRRPEPVPEVPESELRPATRDMVRLLRGARPDMPDAAHAVGLAVRLTTPTTREALAAILTRLAARHAALRTAFPGGGGQARRMRVDREPATPLLRRTDVSDDAGVDVADRLRRLLEPPFDLAEGPLWRFELLDGDGDGGAGAAGAEADENENENGNGNGNGAEGAVDRYLLFGAHHAVSDLQSLLLVAGRSTPNCPAPRSAPRSPTGTSTCWPRRSAPATPGRRMRWSGARPSTAQLVST